MYILIPISIFFLLEEKVTVSLLYSAIIFIFLIFSSELIFNIFNKYFFSEKFKFGKSFSKENVYFISHPYLPYEMKKNMPFINKVKAEYKNLKYDYYFPSLSSNNFGFANGYDGSRKVEIPKEKGLFRINCLGGSTTGNYLEYENKIYSYPIIRLLLI